MAEKRPIGIAVIGSFLTVVGGFTTFLLLIAIFDSLRIQGIKSLWISSPTSFFGFILYGVTPVLFYFTGINLMLSKAWARKAVLFIIPLVSLLFTVHIAFNMAVQRSHLIHQGIGELVTEQFGLFCAFILVFLFVFVPIEYYLNHPRIALYFSSLYSEKSS
jgi:hypothetical protein